MVLLKRNVLVVANILASSGAELCGRLDRDLLVRNRISLLAQSRIGNAANVGECGHVG